MAVLARQDTRINIELDRICRDLWHVCPADVAWPLERAMVFGLTFVGNYSDETRDHIKAYFERIRREDEE